MLKEAMLLVLKAACLAIYALALASFAGYLPGEVSATMQMIAAVFLAVHALELVFVFRYVRLHRGSLAASILLTLLFGVLHWMPLARQRKGA